MRVLILGAAGMLGHKLCQVLRQNFEVFSTVHQDVTNYQPFSFFDSGRLIGSMDCRRMEDILAAMSWSCPDVVVNAIGIVKQLKAAEDPLMSLEVNALLPHRLSLACGTRGARLIHISTDCVFSGNAGRYAEDAVSDAVDLYGRTKYLGEVNAEGVLTIRTSIIGRELKTGHGLVEWFLAQKGGRCRGFSRAIFSGLTTQALGRIISEVIVKHPDLSGLYHISSDPITKYDLLHLINKEYDAGVQIEKDIQFVCDRSLDSTRFREATGWRPDSWQDMIQQMKRDPTPYDKWK